MKSFFKKIVTIILTWEAKRILKKYKPKIIAITGSVGKTGTKDAVYSLLSKTEYTRKSEKSFNSELGVPLTVLGLPNAWSSLVGWIENVGEGFILPWRGNEYPKWLILEMGVDRPGDMQRFGWIKPDIVVFTHFPDVPVHVEYFESPRDVIKEKRELKKSLSPSGTLIVNKDDLKMDHEEVQLEGQNRMSYGFSEHATVRGFDYEIVYKDEKPVGISFKVQFQEKVIDINLNGVIGRHHVYPVLVALTVIISEGKDFSNASESFKEYLSPPGRMRLFRGINGVTIIDDTYNSSPVAVQAGLDTLTSIHVKGRKIVVLGDMLELGDFSVSEHDNLGKAVSASADVFIAVGVRMTTAVQAVKNAKARCSEVFSFKTATEAQETVRNMVNEGDIVFVKGSQGMRMERIVESILLDAHIAVKNLPRQDPHWKIKK